MEYIISKNELTAETLFIANTNLSENVFHHILHMFAKSKINTLKRIGIYEDSEDQSQANSDLEEILKKNKTITAIELENINLMASTIDCVDSNMIREFRAIQCEIPIVEFAFFLVGLKNIIKFEIDMNTDDLKVIIDSLILSDCKNIEEFSLKLHESSDTSHVNLDQRLRILLQRQINLKHLSLTGVPVSLDLLKSIFKKNLVSFSYSDLNIYKLNILFKPDWSSLTKLQLNIEIICSKMIISFKFLENLLSLSLNFQKLSFIDAAIFNSETLKNLKYCYICKAEFGAAVEIIKYISRCSALEDLHIANVQLNFFSTMYIRDLKYLKRLIFDCNQTMSDDLLKNIVGNLPRLNSLVIYECPNISDRFFHELSNLNHQQNLNIYLQINKLQDFDYYENLKKDTNIIQFHDVQELIFKSQHSYKRSERKNNFHDILPK